MEKAIDITEFNYPLPDEKIARFPLNERSSSKLLVYSGGTIAETVFGGIDRHLPTGSLLVFNNTKVIRARLVFHKETGARIEIFCLEPADPADHERAFAATGTCLWHCMVGNSKKWKSGALKLPYGDGILSAIRESDELIRFRWNTSHTFGQLLEELGKIPIPPYLCRESEEVDNSRYQTVYSKFEGSVAAPTAGLHFDDPTLDNLRRNGFSTNEVTLHVGAGTFLPVKEKDARDHRMHTEFFQVSITTLRSLAKAARENRMIAVGTTSVRTIESLAVLGERVILHGSPDPERGVGQWEAYENGAEETTGALDALVRWMEENGLEKLRSSTEIMIVPGYRWRAVRGLVTNFHQPQSTLLLLISALVGESWKKIYAYALDNNFRFLSYGDSSLLLP